MPSPDIRQLEKEILKRAKKERRSGPKPVRLSNLIAQTAWLGGELLWRDGRVVFQVGEKTVRIEEADIVRTARALERLAIRDLRRELADTIAERRKKFQYLREIATLEAPDLKTLCSLSRRQNPKAIERLGALLVVESLVPELLDSSPTRALALAWPLSQPVLESLAKSEIYPEPTRELARFALANRHFEFWQKNTDFPVALCVKLGFSGHGIPHQLEKSGPYSLSYNQIFELYQSVIPTEQILEIASGISNIDCVWPDVAALQMPQPFRECDLQEAQARYRVLERESRTRINEALFALGKGEIRAAVIGAQFLRYWLEKWYEIFLNTPKKRRKQREIEIANLVFEDALKFVQGLGKRQDACEVLEFALEKSREIVADEENPLDSYVAIRNHISFRLMLFCDLAKVIGVEKALEFINEHSLRPLTDLREHSVWFELALEWLGFCEGGGLRSFCWELNDVREKGIPLSLIRSFGRDIENELRLFVPDVRAEIFDGALEEISDSMYFQILVALYKKHSLKISTFHQENQYIWTNILPVFSRITRRRKWSVETSLRIFEITFDVLKGRFDWSKEQENSDDVVRAMRHITALLEFENEQGVERYRIALGKAFEWSQTETAQNLLWDLDGTVAFSIAGRKYLRRALLTAVRFSPRFTFEVLPQIASLKRLHLMDVFDDFESRIPLQGEQWHRFLVRYPALEPEIRDCFAYSQLASEELTAPPISKRWRDYETKTPREMEFLRAKILEQPQNLGLQKRLATLEEQWQTRDVWLQNELRECLLDAASNSAKTAIQNSISSALRARFRVVCGELPPNLELDNDWINAILLACEVEENRKWAVAILRNCARVLVEPNAVNWRENLEGNKPFLAELQARGKNLDVYRARNERQIGEYTLWIELEPLQILQMGNRFDTCLSRGGVNEHSAITNVIDANKKVVYARHFSSIVGRQLLCVSEKFELLGYNVYSTFQSESKEKYALNLAFDEYASLFAEGIGIEKADEGEVPSLCGASWYNDYEIRWETLREEPPEPEKRKKSRSRSSKTTRLSSETTQPNTKESSPIRQTRQNDSSDSRLGISALSSA